MRASDPDPNRRVDGGQAFTCCLGYLVDRLEPPFGAGSDPSNIVDAPYPIGSIQVPGGIEPIVLHRDAVSGGGYVMVATVIGADMDLVGQSPPNITTRFVAVDLDDALQARREREARIVELTEVLSK